MAESIRPLPIISGVNQPFWEAARRRELQLQRCRGCHMAWYPPGPVCPRCWSREHDWAPVSGRGKVTSWVVFHQVYFEYFKDKVPYNVVQVELEEGPRLLSNLVGARNDEIFVGMPVEVCFEDVADKVTLPMFRPRR